MINVDFIDSSEVTTERIYQWDIGRKLKISNIGSAVAPVVHFCNKKSKNALAVESVISGDFYIASVPNSLLEEEYDIIAYIYVGSEEEAKTIKVVHIPVTKRLKPETYVTTEDENVVDFLTISAEMKSLLNGLVITEYDSTKSYIKPNIVYYKGCSYICKSETTITNVLPTDTTKWGLMCESGANISQITFSDDTLHFKLQNNDIVDVPLGSIEIDIGGIDTKEIINEVLTEMSNDENYKLAYPIYKDTDNFLKYGNKTIITKTNLFKDNGYLSNKNTTLSYTTVIPENVSSDNYIEVIGYGFYAKIQIGTSSYVTRNALTVTDDTGTMIIFSGVIQATRNGIELETLSVYSITNSGANGACVMTDWSNDALFGNLNILEINLLEG